MQISSNKHIDETLRKRYPNINDMATETIKILVCEEERVLEAIIRIHSSLRRPDTSHTR